MAARGSVEKEQFTKKILETFEGSFIDEKVIRVPIGEVQLKIAITCAKDIVQPHGDPNAAPTKEEVEAAKGNGIEPPTAEELEEVKEKIAFLNF